MPRTRKQETPADPLEIPAFLRRDKGEKSNVDWSKLESNVTLVNREAHANEPEVNEARQKLEAEIAEEKRQAALRRIARMKERKAIRELPKNSVWDGSRGRWVTPDQLQATTRKRVKRALDDYARVFGNGKSAPAAADVEELTKKVSDTMTKAKTSKKPAAKKPAKAKGKKPEGRGVGIIDEIKRLMSRANGASSDEIMIALGEKFPDRKPNIGTVRIQTSKNQTHKEKDEKRGIVYYIK